MADILNRNAMKSLTYLRTIYYPLLVVLNDIGVMLDVNHFGALLVSFHVRPILVDQIREA